MWSMHMEGMKSGLCSSLGSGIWGYHRSFTYEMAVHASISMSALIGWPMSSDDTIELSQWLYFTSSLVKLVSDANHKYWICWSMNCCFAWRMTNACLEWQQAEVIFLLIPENVTKLWYSQVLADRGTMTLQTNSLRFGRVFCCRKIQVSTKVEASDCFSGVVEPFPSCHQHFISLYVHLHCLMFVMTKFSKL